MTFAGGSPICFLIVAGSGMPGVGFGPGLNGFFNSASLGIPGVGLVPFGNGVTFADMPGAFADGVTEFVENPGGIFAGSIFTAIFEFTFALLFALLAGAPPHPIATNAETNNDNTKTFLNIISNPYLNIAVPV